MFFIEFLTFYERVQKQKKARDIRSKQYFGPYSKRDIIGLFTTYIELQGKEPTLITILSSDFMLMKPEYRAPLEELFTCSSDADRPLPLQVAIKIVFPLLSSVETREVIQLLKIFLNSILKQGKSPAAG